MAEEQVKRGRGRPRKNPPPEPKAAIVKAKPRGQVLDVRNKFNEERAATALEAIASGANHKTAANLAGVSQKTFSEWLSRGENDPDGPFGQWALNVRQAQAKFEQAMLEKVIEHSEAKGNWIGFMTILERRFSEHWRRPSEAAQVQVNIGTFGESMKEIDGGVIDAEVVPGD